MEYGLLLVLDVLDSVQFLQTNVAGLDLASSSGHASLNTGSMISSRTGRFFKGEGLLLVLNLTYSKSSEWEDV